MEREYINRKRDAIIVLLNSLNDFGYIYDGSSQIAERDALIIKELKGMDLKKNVF